MGASATKESRLIEQPQDIAEFRRLPSPSEEYVIPEIPEKRKVTDLKFTIAFAICIALLVPFLIYTFIQSDLDRFVRGYDPCGNICGKKNPIIDGIYCSGKDEINYPLLQYSQINNRTRPVSFECVESCDKTKNVIILNRCFPTNDDTTDLQKFYAEVAEDIKISASYIVLLSFIGLGLCVGMLVLFRYFTAVIVWFILIGSVTFMIILTVVLWVAFSNASEKDKGVKYVAILFTLISVGLVILLICMIKRIKLVIRLFKEAIKIVFGMPWILLEPLLTLLATTILFVIFIIFALIISTSGHLQPVGSDVYDYVPDTASMFTLFWHVVISLWMLQFIVGCQHMVISGAVSAYYFARDKSTLRSPIYYSFYNLIKYHLGTVAFGSLIITIVALIKALVRSLVSNRYAKVFVECCLQYVEDFLQFLSKNAYIQTAMHGQPFYKSGKRAVRLLAANFISTIAVNSVGDFVLNMAKLMIMLGTIGIGVLMYDDSVKHFWAGIVIAAIVTSIIADCFFTVFETAIDTLFLCFCEDRMINDGEAYSYYMTTNLMQYMEDAKNALPEKDRR